MCGRIKNKLWARHPIYFSLVDRTTNLYWTRYEFYSQIINVTKQLRRAKLQICDLSEMDEITHSLNLLNLLYKPYAHAKYILINFVKFFSFKSWTKLWFALNWSCSTHKIAKIGRSFPQIPITYPTPDCRKEVRFKYWMWSGSGFNCAFPQ